MYLFIHIPKYLVNDIELVPPHPHVSSQAQPSPPPTNTNLDVVSAAGDADNVEVEGEEKDDAPRRRPMGVVHQLAFDVFFAGS